MKPGRATLKQIARHFDKIHVELAYLREHIDTLEDETAEEFFNQMEFGALSPMRKLRKHLSIPYVWQENQEVGSDGPSDENSNGELLCEAGSQIP